MYSNTFYGGYTMDTFLTIMGYVSGPLIGAIIGYFTNYLAVKMLFRPYYPIRIGKWKLPFTPGIIPKRQMALAKAVGNAVGTKLFTGDDLLDVLGGETIEKKLSDLVVEKVKGLDEDVTVHAIVAQNASEEKFSYLAKTTSAYLTNRIVSAAKNMDVGNIVVTEGKGFVEKKLGFLGAMVAPMLPTIGESINRYIEEHGEEKILPYVEKELISVADEPISRLSEKIDEEQLRKITIAVYRQAVLPEVNKLLASINIAEIVEDKVNAMSVKELETLCMSVMKKELSAIVNLGALIGLLLGIINIFL